VQGDSGSLLVYGSTVALSPALALVDHCAWRELQDHPGSTFAAWHYRLKARLEPLLDLAAGRTLELIDRHWVSSPCQPSRACLLCALACGGSMSTLRRSERSARCRACTGCSTRRERRLVAYQAHECLQACTGVQSLLSPALGAVGNLCLPNAQSDLA